MEGKNEHIKVDGCIHCFKGTMGSTVDPQTDVFIETTIDVDTH